jgi:hypothetical protein
VARNLLTKIRLNESHKRIDSIFGLARFYHLKKSGKNKNLLIEILLHQAQLVDIRLRD